jgi:hypothetical protein
MKQVTIEACDKDYALLQAEADHMTAWSAARDKKEIWTVEQIVLAYALIRVKDLAASRKPAKEV